jgi:Zn-dependent protease
MTEQRTPGVPGGWLPPVAPDTFEAPERREPPPSPFGEEPRPWWRRLGGPLAVIVALVVKWGVKLKALLLLLPKLKVLTTSGSMLVSVAAYSLIWGWRFAVGFVVLLFVHEMGHVIQLRREGIAASAPVFIPFMGALVWMKELAGNALAEARVGLAGPVLGSLGAAACIPLVEVTGNDLFRALAFTGFFLNLFNLLPFGFLDGGRAAAAMSPKIWLVGLVGMVALVLAWPNPIILLIAVLGGMETWRRFRALRSGDAATQDYYRVRPRDRALVAAVYLGLIALLVLGMDATHIARTFADV